ncbi:hypothetical protein MRB53_002774 [Persea americana]|uniref:Uncharacterized protein n=1 Tax=Persea americana TaxID=3435 RepID=A0ACC2MVF6_PERAE|nr:hypothetical protein MRB53_002774 [Persea americana]
MEGFNGADAVGMWLVGACALDAGLRDGGHWGKGSDDSWCQATVLGEGFAEGRIRIGETEILKITKFQHVWSCNLSNDNTDGASFYKPIGMWMLPKQKPDIIMKGPIACQLFSNPLIIHSYGVQMIGLRITMMALVISGYPARPRGIKLWVVWSQTNPTSLPLKKWYVFELTLQRHARPIN